MKKDFDILREKVKSGHILIFHDAERNIGDEIEWFTNGTCSHVEQSVGFGKLIGARLDGVKEHDITEYFYDRFTITVREIIGLRDDQAEKMRQVAYEMVAAKWEYGWTAYFGFLLFCVLHKIGINLFWLPNPTTFPSYPVCSGVPDITSKAAHSDCFPGVGYGSVTPQHWMESDRLRTVVQV
jgi:hypothetical protein